MKERNYAVRGTFSIAEKVKSRALSYARTGMRVVTSQSSQTYAHRVLQREQISGTISKVNKGA